MSEDKSLSDFETPEHFEEIRGILDGSTPWLDPENDEFFPPRAPEMDYGVLLEGDKDQATEAMHCHDYAEIWSRLQKKQPVKAAWLPQLRFGIPWFLLPGVAAPDESHAKARLADSSKEALVGAGLCLYGIFGLKDPLFVMIGIFLILPALDAFLQWITFPRNQTPHQLYRNWVRGNLFQQWMIGRSAGIAAWPVIALIAVLAVVYLVQLSQSEEFSLFGVGIGTVFDGGMRKDRVLDHGESWRLLTSGFLHGSLVHIGFNTYALYHTGRVVLSLSSAWHLMIVFLASVLGGSLCSLALNSPLLIDGEIIHRPSVGASGGIMGVIGFLLFRALTYRDSIPRGFAKLLIRNVVIIAIMGIIGMRFIDNAGHLGGFLTGLAVSAVIRPKQKDWWAKKPSRLVESLGVVSVAVLAWAAFRAILAITTGH